MGSNPNTFEVIETLVEQGWISLRQMAVLLGLKELRGIYSRQKGKNQIPTVRIGGIDRVYPETVVEVLTNEPEKKQADAKVVLSLYLAALRSYNRRHKGDQHG